MLISCQQAETPKAVPDDVTDSTTPAPDQFMSNLAEYCRQSFEGKVITDDPADADWKKERLVIHFTDCRRAQISIPLHVGDDRSRTWVLTQMPDALRLKHDHRHKDGKSDSVTMYGGDTVEMGTAYRQSFPVDADSIAMFKKEGLTASIVNVWTISLDPGKTLTYELKRPGRLFQAQFDLTHTVDTPPPAWGHE